MRRDNKYDTLRHCHGNLLTAVDVETTGTNPDAHDVFQVCFMPLNATLQPIRGLNPFYMSIKPRRPENVNYNAVRITRFNFLDLMKYALDADYVADLFLDWFYHLELPEGKKLAPLWSNGDFDRDFLRAWLGTETYNETVHYHDRDTQETAIWLNDRYSMAGKPLPFNRVGLNSLAAVLGVENENPHDSLSDCLTTAAVYKELVMFPVPDIDGNDGAAHDLRA